MSVSNEELAWFHCGRCGSLFRALPGDSPLRTCTECGRPPSWFGDIVSAPRQVLQAPAVAARLSPDTAPVVAPVRPKPKVRKTSAVVKVIVAWILLCGGLLFMFRNHKDEAPQASVPMDRPAAGPSAEDAALLNSAISQCLPLFAGFLQSHTPEERNQYVMDPIRMAGRMAKFYNFNPLASFNLDSAACDNRELLRIGDKLAVSTLWKAEGGKEIEAVFFKQDGEWRLDWEHFVRYGDASLQMFVAGEGEETAEFRLLARERLAADRKDEKEMSLVFYSPRFGKPAETGGVSPEFLVPRDSEDGKLLAAAFRLEHKGGWPFGATIPSGDPEDMIRVRVRIRRDADKKFHLEKVLACHWLAVDAPGVELPAAEDPVPEGIQVPGTTD